MPKHSIKFDFHLSPRLKLRMSQSSITIRVKYEKNRFKDYIDTMAEDLGVCPLVTDIVKIEDHFPLPSMLLPELTEALSNILVTCDRGKNN